MSATCPPVRTNASERRPLLHVGEQVLPDAVARPPAEVLVDRVPAPEPIGQVSPRRSRAEPPRGRLDHCAPIHRRTAPCPRRQEHVPDQLPDLVRDDISRHDSRITQRPHVVLWSSPAQERGDRPLLVLLHGYGSHEGDLFGLVPHLPSAFVVAAVRAPLAPPVPDARVFVVHDRRRREPRPRRGARQCRGGLGLGRRGAGGCGIRRSPRLLAGGRHRAADAADAAAGRGVRREPRRLRVPRAASRRRRARRGAPAGVLGGAARATRSSRPGSSTTRRSGCRATSSSADACTRTWRTASRRSSATCGGSSRSRSRSARAERHPAAASATRNAARPRVSSGLSPVSASMRPTRLRTVLTWTNSSSAAACTEPSRRQRCSSVSTSAVR